jgi:hypothetical protein
MVIKIIGALLVIWLAFTLIGFLFKAVVWLLVAAAVVTVGAAAYGAIKGKSDRPRIRG